MIAQARILHRIGPAHFGSNTASQDVPVVRLRENGATLFLKGSHRIEQMPSDRYFEHHAVQVEGKAGDILLFDSLVVHAAAPNRDDAMRRALTLCFGRPFRWTGRASCRRARRQP